MNAKYVCIVLVFVLGIGSSLVAQEATEEVTAPNTEVQTSNTEPESTEEPRGLPEFTGTVNAVFIPENDMPLIGEPVNVNLLIETPIDVEITVWPLFPIEEGGVFEILETGDIERVETGRSIRYSQIITFIIWEPGLHITPEIPIVYRTNTNPADQFSPLRSTSFDVPDLFPVTVDQSLRSSAPPIYMNHIPTWYWIAGAIGVVAVLWSFRYIWMLQIRRRDHVVMTAGTPGQVAISRLTKLRGEDTTPIQVYAIVADTLRVYLQKRLNISTQERTTFEIMTQLRSQSYLPEKHYQQLQQILEEADLVKFAKFEPEDRAGNRMVEIATRWIESMERIRVGGSV